MKLLILSNGHGEDEIAVRIAEQLQLLSNQLELVAFPLVGTGKAYHSLNIPIRGPVQSMPSGGFIYMDGRQLLGDVQKGLLQLTLAQHQTVRRWSLEGGRILAVGDILPVLLAWLSNTDYAFVGTAKSEYYLRDEQGWLPQTSSLERRLGSYYFPWERWLMSRPRCKAVFPRDTLTSKILQQWPIPVYDLGNPMMDGLENQISSTGNISKESLTVVLLPGSRAPEAYRNWEIILQSLENIILALKGYRITFLAAIAPSLSIDSFQVPLLAHNWHPKPLEQLHISLNDPNALAFTYNHKINLILSQNAYTECLGLGNIAIAMAGTATEQFVGLGKPAIIIPGEGPQFTLQFAQNQTRLLGCSVILVPQPQQVGHTLKAILNDPDRWQEIDIVGKRRMGKPGAALRIARLTLEKLF
ncbi:hypothetical protein C7H19_07770 [Aphanothece hegewaldii CCALA 016]|uniref:Lipid-A-disaccharide synthase n=1 Tax=Aphanothece hegewaldii CCALA 016 TaxID=2107694 RepID=A0A2T1LZP8_9CHRO|nr:lipid-A-disaccharide synthase-related protein [Aphanothece hegewaldii]PSF37872.1 hypothetical protein C7H19_07770 [Aphanothece hegewaldii CCALA 016]